ncbi:hypothetical protein [Moorena sp. SIO3H5]|uniref:hypothetical protein n=1 Tax=Moorena sp. SIO3H5 TaxID=2607834 RepID=UPI0013B9FEA1|nr:hypothetical protein [Moorena sp. SIO3H5]NEO73207.1 hypothetical protein [Moorena sp. SIO3H5]
MRYTLFFPTSDFRLLTSDFPAPCSLLPKTQKFLPHNCDKRYKMHFSLPILLTSTQCAQRFQC